MPNLSRVLKSSNIYYIFFVFFVISLLSFITMLVIDEFFLKNNSPLYNPPVIETEVISEKDLRSNVFQMLFLYRDTYSEKPLTSWDPSIPIKSYIKDYEDGFVYLSSYYPDAYPLKVPAYVDCSPEESYAVDMGLSHIMLNPVPVNAEYFGYGSDLYAYCEDADCLLLKGPCVIVNNKYDKKPY